MQFMKNIIWPRTLGLITDVACMFELYETLQEPDPTNILGWGHINFLKSNTYSAILLPKASIVPNSNEFMRVTKHFMETILTKKPKSLTFDWIKNMADCTTTCCM
jgi:hypothetical protein